MIKMINYIRSEVQQGNETPDLSSSEAFQEERFLKPALEQDPLLYSLDEIVGSFELPAPAAVNGISRGLPFEDTARNRIAELEEELRCLQKQFSAYRETVDQTLEKRWNGEENDGAESRDHPVQSAIQPVPRDDDTHYFSSYASNGQ